MGKATSCFILLIIIVVEIGGWCEGCLKEESIALLRLKNSSSFPSDGMVSNWGSTEDCCSWDGISCNTTTGHVVAISLANNNQYPVSPNFYLNASLFLPFQNLNALDLFGNGIAGCLKNEGFEKLSGLANLEVLYLSNNAFNVSVLASLAGLSSIRSLDLSYNKLNGSIEIGGEYIDQYPISPHFYLNASLFLPFQNLNALNLQGNGIAGCLKNEGFEKLSGLANLEKLDLSWNAFNVSVLASLASLSSLKYLYLSENKLNGSIEIGELDGLINLESLHLGGNIDRFAFSKDSMSLRNLSGLSLNSTGTSIKIESLGYIKSLRMEVNNLDAIIFPQDESEMKSLEELSLNSQSGSSSNFLETIGSLTSLKALSISNCGMLGRIPSRGGLCELRNLQSLYMSNNHLNGTLPWCLANMTSLQFLDLSNNHFTGDISASPLKALTSIQTLYISNNLFQIPISLLPFYNHSKLGDLDAGNNQFEAQPESHLDHDDLVPKFQLIVLSLSGNGYGGPFPKFLYHQVDLRSVDFSNLKLKGGFPNWLLENNTRLYRLKLLDASLSGPFLLPNQSHTNIETLDVSGNYFDGHIPTQIGGKLPNLNYLDMSRSGFNGTIPPSLGDMNSLRHLDLSHNAFSGGIPEHLATGCSWLSTLKLSNNSLEGQIFSNKFNLTNLYSLQLDHNRFSGSVPEILFNLTDFRILDLSNNFLSGNLSSMSFSRASDLEEVYLSTNKLEGSLGDAFYGCRNLLMLDLSHNGLTGTIPKWYDKLSRLNFLLLSHNNLNGEIPLQLCNLDDLSLIDLSDNKLSGQVPPCLNVSSYSDRERTAVSYLPPVSGFQPFNFTKVGNSYVYHGNILNFICGIDLSSNNLTGDIPPLIGYLETIQVLNLSRNNLIGPIPISFSHLKDIESLDLSHNRLTGRIPPELVGLTFLSMFNVAHNNLSGRLPDMGAQFATFNASSYEGNHFLCGPPLPRSCSDGIASPSSTASPKDDDDDEWGIDMEAFYVTFSVAYIMVLLGIAAVLYINPHWRRVWFYFIEVRMANCYYFLVDSLPITNRLKYKLSCL